MSTRAAANTPLPIYHLARRHGACVGGARAARDGGTVIAAPTRAAWARVSRASATTCSRVLRHAPEERRHCRCADTRACGVARPAADEHHDRLRTASVPSTTASRRAARLAFLAAVVKKFSDDQAGQLAALIAYYGFVSLFPLLLVLVTVLGFVLQGDPAERAEILNGALGQFPLISDQLKLHSLTGQHRALRSASSGRCWPGWASRARRRTPSTGSGACPSRHARTSFTRACAASACSRSSAR